MVVQSAAAGVPPVTDQPTGVHQPGKLVWADLLTDDVEAAKTFYGAVFGWEFRSSDDPLFTLVVNGDRPIAGLISHQPKDPAVSEVQWLVSISIANPDAAARVARNNGGEVFLDPEDYPDRGRHTVIADPSGAAVALLRTSGGDPKDQRPAFNDLLWAELWTHDPQAMAQFYRKVVGFDITPVKEQRGAYLALSSGGRMRAGVVELPWDDVLPNWTTYLLVENTAETAALVRQHGGTVLLPPSDELEDGSIAIIEDPTGGVLAIQQRKNAP